MKPISSGARARAAKKSASSSTQQVDDALRLLLRGEWNLETVPPEILRLGQPALERLLDAPDGVFWDSYMEWRDYGATRKLAIAAFAKRDMDSVLAAMAQRRWTEARVALSGVGLVRDARVVPFLVAACADEGPPVRALAVELLGNQRDPAATAAALRALRDRSSDVKLAAVRALRQIGDPTLIEALAATAARNKASVLITEEVAKALAEIRRAAARS